MAIMTDDKSVNKKSVINGNININKGKELNFSRLS